MLDKEQGLIKDKFSVPTSLFGAGGHSKVVREIIESSGGLVDVCYDRYPEASVHGSLPVLPEEDYCGDSPVIIAVGDNRLRFQITGRIAAKYPEKDGSDELFATAVHPSAIVSPSARIGKGTVVMAGAVIQPGAVIGSHCIVNTCAVVEHDCVIGDYSAVSPGAVLCGGVRVGEGVCIGAGATVIQCLEIGEWTMVGAGSVVVRNLPAFVKAYGNPCRIKGETANNYLQPLT